VCSDYIVRRGFTQKHTCVGIYTMQCYLQTDMSFDGCLKTSDHIHVLFNNTIHLKKSGTMFIEQYYPLKITYKRKNTYSILWTQLTTQNSKTLVHPYILGRKKLSEMEFHNIDGKCFQLL
jgi:hypothetical protein